MRRMLIALLFLVGMFAVVGGRHPLRAQSAIAYKVIDLGTFADGTFGSAVSINNHGEATGRADHYDPATFLHTYRAFFWKDRNGNGVSDPGEMIDIGTFGGSSIAVGINDAGEVAGYSEVATPNGIENHIFRWKDANANGVSAPAEMVDLGVGTPYRIGNGGAAPATAKG